SQADCAAGAAEVHSQCLEFSTKLGEMQALAASAASRAEEASEKWHESCKGLDSRIEGLELSCQRLKFAAKEAAAVIDSQGAELDKVRE
ncbi:unnamed protein product, partial [Polarella glacialis]